MLPVPSCARRRMLILRLTLTLALGLSIGFALRFVSHAPVAHACECSPPTWNLSLDRVTSTDPAIDHEPHWDTTAKLWGSPPDSLWFDSDHWRPELIANMSLEP